MKSFITLTAFFSSFTFVPQLLGQYYIAGDTTLYHSWNIAQTYTPNDIVDIDIDCDGMADLSFISIDGNAPGFPWDRLSLDLGEGVEVCNSGTGFVTGFEQGDTIHFGNAYWTSFLDFIYGTGAAGTYGQASITNKFLAFRKTGDEAYYTFIRFSNQGLVFTIHQVISFCEANPLLNVLSDFPKESPYLYPNPFHNVLVLKNGALASSLSIHDVSGRLMGTFITGEIEVENYTPGFYVVKYVLTNGKTTVQKLFNQ